MTIVDLSRVRNRLFKRRCPGLYRRGLCALVDKWGCRQPWASATDTGREVFRGTSELLNSFTMRLRYIWAFYAADLVTTSYARCHPSPVQDIVLQGKHNVVADSRSTHTHQTSLFQHSYSAARRPSKDPTLGPSTSFQIYAALHGLAISLPLPSVRLYILYPPVPH